jgi:Carboxypeptidase regulatory-like domain
VSGVVLNENGAPVAGATIRFDGAETWAVAPGSFTRVVTDWRGRFRFDGVLYGNFRLIAEAPWGVATVLLARVETSDVTGLDVTIPKTWPISGRLIDEQHRQLAGALVTRMRPNLGGQRHIAWDFSAADGSFRLLPLGSRVFARTPPGAGPALVASFSDGGEANVVERGGGFPARLAWTYPGRPPETIILRRGAYASGRAVLDDGSPARGALLFAASLGGGVHDGPKPVDDDGHFRVGPVEPGRVSVSGYIPVPGSELRGATTVELVSGERLSGVKVLLRPRMPSAR